MFAPVPMAITLPGGSQMTSSSPVAGQLSAPAPQGQQQISQGGELPALGAPRESMIDISRIEGQVRESSVKKVGEVVQSHPEEALAILRTWLHQPV
jgi:flagellar M-ring protein FliF